MSEQKNDELVVAINKFIKSLDLEQIIQELSSMNQGQVLVKLNQIRNGLNMNGEDLNMMMSQIATALENYTLKDLANLNEAQIVSTAQKVINQIRTYQDMIFGKIFAIADSLGVEKSKAFECVSNFVDIINILSDPNKVEQVVRENKDGIIAIVHGFADIVELYELEPFFRSILNAMKEAPYKERS